MTIEERLENMERELGHLKRRNRWLLGAVFLVAGGLIVPGMFETTAIRAQSQNPRTAQEIRARSFILEDENGIPRAMLIVDKDGSRLSLHDETGKGRVALGALKDGPGLTLIDKNGTGRAGLAVIKDGPGLMLNDENGDTRAVLGALKDGPVLALYNENNANRVGLTVTKDGPNLAMHDKNGTARFVAGKFAIEMPNGKTIEYPESSLVLFGPDGKIIWSAIK
ncbi:MAG: hypothetical protein NTV82_02770 [Candidatus Aminicenantes bacterium]|nr:hypothetical protein [Candidatus Aminicenantes bacterium]